MSSTFQQKFMCRNSQKHHHQFIISKLEARNMTFEHTKLCSKEKAMKVGVEIMAIILRKRACPNEDEEKKYVKN